MMPGLSDVERQLYTDRLKDAETKRHDLVTGVAVKRFIDQNGETVEYTTANLSALDRYITSLKELLNPCVARYNRPRPIGFLF